MNWNPAWALVFCLLLIFGCSGGESNQDAQPDNPSFGGPPNGQWAGGFGNRTNRSFNRTGPGPGQMPEQINASVEEVSKAFDTMSSDELFDYCRSRMRGCGQYCEQVNPSHEFCNIAPNRRFNEIR
ncbi:MAG: hypothetical protein ABIF01_00530 [Candidatus Micrarchaeota archaeon]